MLAKCTANEEFFLYKNCIVGTGKTLVAAALASEINREGIGKVSFFQRKGADILDKWVGESEKNLRTIFEKVFFYYFYKIDLLLLYCRLQRVDLRSYSSMS